MGRDTIRSQDHCDQWFYHGRVKYVYYCIDHNEPKPQVNYMAYFEWAAIKRKTHHQRQCSECKLWLVWVPRMREGVV